MTKLQRRITMLMDRLRLGHGNQSVIVREVVKAHNAARADQRRRWHETQIRGWQVMEQPTTDTNCIEQPARRRQLAG